MGRSSIHSVTKWLSKECYNTIWSLNTHWISWKKHKANNFVHVFWLNFNFCVYQGCSIFRKYLCYFPEYFSGLFKEMKQNDCQPSFYNLWKQPSPCRLLRTGGAGTVDSNTATQRVAVPIQIWHMQQISVRRLKSSAPS